MCSMAISSGPLALLFFCRFMVAISSSSVISSMSYSVPVGTNGVVGIVFVRSCSLVGAAQCLEDR